MKKQKTKILKPRGRRSRRGEHEHADPLEAALGVAARLAAPYAEEVESINNVIRFVRRQRHGRSAKVRLTDVLLALSILLGSTKRSLTPEEHAMLAGLDFLLGTPAHAVVVRAPGVRAGLPPLALALHQCEPCTRRTAPSASPVPQIRLAA